MINGRSRQHIFFKNNAECLYALPWIRSIPCVENPFVGALSRAGAESGRRKVCLGGTGANC